jgi:hypothetical protein
MVQFERAIDLTQVSSKHAGNVIKQHEGLVVCSLMICFISLLEYFAVLHDAVSHSYQK